ncbi:MAG: hypothetical protein IKQ37_06960 [Bacteroidaceae bacterium]|nr:hypothetical protein [Bacteroidaceae bacterium]
MNKIEIIEKIEGVERELKGIREALSQDGLCKAPEKSNSPFDTMPDISINYTLENLYEAFGKKKQPFARRLKHALMKHRIHTLEGFLNLSAGEVLGLENVGYETMLQTKKALARLGISW